MTTDEVTTPGEQRGRFSAVVREAPGVDPVSTSVPRWDATDLEALAIDPDVRHWLVATSADMRTQVERFAHRLPAATVVDIDDGLADALRTARAGWRIVLVGPQRSVARARSRSLAAGALDCEVLSVSTDGASGFDAATVDVFCAHCHHVSSGDVGIGGTITCGGCDRELAVAHHFSQRHHAYLGSLADGGSRHGGPGTTAAAGEE